MPESPPHQPESWLDEEISSLLDAVEPDRAAGEPEPEAPAPRRRYRRKRAYRVRVRAPALPIRGLDVSFVVLGVGLALLIAWLVPFLSRP